MQGERNAAQMGKRARASSPPKDGFAVANVAKPQNPFIEGNEENEDSDLGLKPIWLC
jgi:hypothetical protein